MMLHEAVMLEIYRQALNASELASPRCHSRESNGSGAAGDGRCPSNDSHCSGNDNVTPAATPVPTSPPVGLPLQATLAPAAAAALLPPQSAMAAYLNAAAAAAQQNHLLLTNPLAAAASFVQQATQGHSPIEGGKNSPIGSPSATIDAPALDFSTKYGRRLSETGSAEDDDVNDVGKKGRGIPENADGDDNAADEANAPLDLSVGKSRKRQSEDSETPLRKTPRPSDYKPLAPGTWVPPINPYLAAVAAANLSPKSTSTSTVNLDCWSNKQKYAPNEATKALEKMTEMTRLGSGSSNESARISNPTTNSSSSASAGSSNGRHSAWQSHWLTKGADAVKDVFKCVWCKQSFPTLASLTVHMKETQHCGVNVPAAVAAGSVNANANANVNAASTTISTISHHASRHSNAQSSNGGSNASSSASNASSASTAGPVSTTSSGKSDLNLLIKETMPLPRKLVRGQDVWLGKGAEQTRQILKCMWCGQSFRSLAEMTNHMQETQHYTNIISQEQIISWKSSDEKLSGSGTSSGTGNSPSSAGANTSAATAATAAVNTAVSAVLTCKVCDQAFPTLKELSNHMVKNSHYKEHMIRTAAGGLDGNMSNNTSPGSNAPRRGGRQMRGEKRKKSLPVRKLLEMERAQHDYKIGNSSLDSALKPLRDFAASTKITCEKCGDKIETALFVDHIRQCLGGHIPMSPRHTNNNHNNNNNLKSSYGEQRSNPQTPQSMQSDGRKTADMEMISPLTASSRSEMPLCPLPKDGEKSTSSTPSVLNAIEQLIEKSFDTRMRNNNSSYAASATGSKPSTPLGSSILKRLGIDDSVDYTKPLMDPQAMHFLRSYSSYSAPRDRSASESSSVSERCSSRLESSVTPERSVERSRQATPRLITPEKPPTTMETESEEPKIKSEPNLENEESDLNEPRAEISEEASQVQQVHKISVKKEFSMQHEVDERKLEHEEENAAGRAANAVSPSLSERSLTPKSTSSQTKATIASTIGNSLNALSSMFDSLNSMTTNGNNLSATETNNNHSVGGKKSSANPLAALQKLCENTTDPPAANTRSSATAVTSAVAGNNTALGNMVAFSWACNDGLMASPDPIKCSYCDLPFSSKGAYRHHLSKVHFVKDDSMDCNNLKSPGLAASPKSIPASSPKRCSSKSPITQRQSASPAANIGAVITPTINPYDESPQSKFLKYTELAKQLSSKNS